MNQSRKNKIIKKAYFVIFLTGLALFVASMVVSFWAAGYFDRTKTPPLVNLTLSQPACKYLSQSGIPVEVNNGLCKITTRYRQGLFEKSRAIEISGKPPLQICDGLIIAVVQLEDGSDEPWSDEHKKALRYLIGSMSLMMLFLTIVLKAIKRDTQK
ncbi:MAG: hypothetical protein B7Y56_10785 [Gallionellales bacterium 35-53-114]|jgi:hypothetical protein|nr:MAG: hypothetical protein B7Y56_10785 [Gallionellales bacterium 35-53-114]OYZ64892.1 MAG: hypothetical protein B7Y04_03815 [Gallionellales bacterium 24-53-125]OZB07570.1 MAG: hypothetical protein B7X61_13200 [Gallionellales bacterium 39-52-133]HQS58750.1 hypothetical protein [Gallionellaceae bacterium]HQS75090.1 hypothetical protein [Gallionellaceae bacterium]